MENFENNEELREEIQDQVIQPDEITMRQETEASRIEVPEQPLPEAEEPAGAEAEIGAQETAEPEAEEPTQQSERITFEIHQEPQPEPRVTSRPTQPTQPPRQKKYNGLFWILAILLAVSLLVQTVSLVGGIGSTQIQGASINDKGELVLTYSNGETQNLGTVVGKDGNDGVDGTTTVVSDGESKGVAITNGLRSSVSIYCTFTQENRWGGFGGHSNGSETEYYSAGSGVIYQLDQAAGDAIIVTNYHVVFDSDSSSDNGIADTITVYLYGSEITGMEMEATYIGGSMYYDLAVLQIRDSDILRNSDASAVTVASSDDVQVGSTAIAIGNAEGSGISTTFGVVSVASEYITMTAADGLTSVNYRVMRVDTAVNSGNSGGGLFDEYGNLIGIVNAKTVDDGVENIGYALPSSVVVAVVDNILDYCLDTECENVMRPILGVTVQTIESKAEYDSETGMLSIVETVQVQSVEKDQLGKVFEVGDLLVSATLNGSTKMLTRQYHLIDLMVTARPGDTVDFIVLRNNEEVKISVTIDGTCLTAY